MRKDEAEKVIDIILECDGGCQYCVSSLLNLFISNFNEYEHIAYRAFKDKFGINLEDFFESTNKKA